MKFRLLYDEMIRNARDGLGIGLAESDWGRIFFHGGNNGDFRYQFTVYEDLKMGFAVCTNANTGRFLADDLARFLVEGKDQQT